MYTTKDISHILHKSLKEIVHICHHFNLGDKGKYSANDLAFIKKIVDQDEEFLRNRVRQFIKENLFVTLKQINRHTGLRNPFAENLLVDLTHSDPDIAETDNDSNGTSYIFYVNEATIAVLKARGDWDWEYGG